MSDIARSIADRLDAGAVTHFEPLGAGHGVRRARLATDDGRACLVKIGTPENADALAAEADGLVALFETGTAAVPRVLARELDTDPPWLAMTWLKLGPLDAAAAGKLGAQLAAMHADRSRPYGWHRDNYLGASPQINTPSEDWAQFFIDCRLAPQWDWLTDRSPAALPSDWYDPLMGAVRELLDHQPPASLLHGDLWGGNAGAVEGRPVIFDPAVHIGDRECDLAMAALFGGVPPAFFEAYRAAWPLPDGHETREPVYRLYHLLNHANLFGGGYLDSCRELIPRILESR